MRKIVTIIVFFAVVVSSVITAGVASAVTRPVCNNIVTHPIFSGKERYSHTSHPVEHYNIYTENGGSYQESLRLTERCHVYSPAFTVVSNSGGWIYPNIGQGAERGMTIGETGHRNTWTPVHANYDGDPTSHVSTTLKWSGSWNAGYDIWFEPHYDDMGHNQGHGGTEIMVWNAAVRGGYPIFRGPGWTYNSVWADGRMWNVNASSGAWHRIYFVSTRTTSSFSGNLNPFFHYAIQDGYLDPNAYLSGLDYGFEISRGGNGLSVNNYLLQGVSNSPALHEGIQTHHHRPVHHKKVTHQKNHKKPVKHPVHHKRPVGRHHKKKYHKVVHHRRHHHRRRRINAA